MIFARMLMATALALVVLDLGGVALADQPTATCFGEPVTLGGTDGDDVLRGTDGRDVVDAGAGDDSVRGLKGDDLICGGSGDDVLIGDTGDDHVDGGASGVDGDRVSGGVGDDLIAGDARALVDFRGAAAGVTVDLAAQGASGAGNDTLQGLGGVIGSARADVLVGNAAANTLIGLGGGDEIYGAGGRDQIFPDSRDDLGVPTDRADDEVHINGDDGTGDTVVAQGGGDRILGGSGRDSVSGVLDSGAMVEGGDQRDEIDLAGSYTAHGGAGPDALIHRGGGESTLFGDEGTDHLSSGTRMYGGANGDAMSGVYDDPTGVFALTLVADGGGARDSFSVASIGDVDDDDLRIRLIGAGFVYRVDGGVERSVAVPRTEEFRASARSVTFDGTDGPDDVSLRASRDLTVRLGGGADTLYAGYDRATLQSPGLGVYELGEGDDAVFLSARGRRAVQHRVTLGGGDDSVGGSVVPGSMRVDGGSGRDSLYGGGADDVLKGGPDPDAMLGGGGDDRLFGDEGADDLRGGRGTDALDGGPGKDGCDGEKETDCERNTALRTHGPVMTG